jgi:cytochrome c553
MDRVLKKKPAAPSSGRCRSPPNRCEIEWIKDTREYRAEGMMRATNPRLALQAAVIVLALTAAGRADERGAGGSARQGFQAKVEYCKTCHGLSGEGYRGYYPMPRLAGQQPKYLENQLRAFLERRRVNPVMFNVAHALSPATLSALATHFNGLNPVPLGGAPRERLALGKTIYDDGVPEANIAACSACHGPDGKGQQEVPRLAGQLFPYTVKALNNWSKERGQGAGKEDPSAIMAPTAHNLNEAQIAAIAAYLSYLK